MRKLEQFWIEDGDIVAIPPNSLIVVNAQKYRTKGWIKLLYNSSIPKDVGDLALATDSELELTDEPGLCIHSPPNLYNCTVCADRAGIK